MSQEYAFAAPVLRMDTGLRQHYVPLPREIGDVLWEAGVRRLVCTFNGFEIRRAIQGHDGERVIMLGLPLLREARAKLGDMVQVVLRPDPDPDFIDLGEEFAAVLDQDPEAANRYYSLNPGHQRSLAYYATSAKRPETRIKRALELAHKLKTRTLSIDLQSE
jgi:hypothetical protein